ncbi:MFS transporter [Paraburkholderia terrae]|uniref:MFS transporter n=2 Tax=Burkholderiaceae TaxID=119060 RepID=A0A2I8F0T3_9BURK|nr:MFS transporter [Paraburkholderia terrae]
MEHHLPARSRASLNPWLICAACFLVIAVDGFDTSAIAYVAPALTHIWHLPHAAMTPAFIATSVGAVLGYLLSGAIAKRMSRRSEIALATLAFAAFSLLTVVSSGILMLSVIRFFTAVCLGLVVPASISLAADSAPDHARASATIAAATGLSAGSAFGGLLSAKLIAEFGWEAVFIAGGLVPVLLLPAIRYAIPREQTQTSAPIDMHRTIDDPVSGKTRGLLAPGLVTDTTTVWLVAFLGFLVTYLFIFWTPMLLLSYGFTASSAALGAAASAFGGITGNVLLFLLERRLGVQRSLIITISITMVCIAGFQMDGLSQWAVLLLIFGVGIGTTSACVGQATLATVLYPKALRTTGVGYAAAVGRFGAIIGPSLGGFLISLGMSAQRIVLLSCVPLTIVAIVLIFSHTRITLQRKALTLS